jgi:hypothetical protein
VVLIDVSLDLLRTSSACEWPELSGIALAPYRKRHIRTFIGWLTAACMQPQSQWHRIIVMNAIIDSNGQGSGRPLNIAKYFTVDELNASCQPQKAPKTTKTPAFTKLF